MLLTKHTLLRPRSFFSTQPKQFVFTYHILLSRHLHLPLLGCHLLLLSSGLETLSIRVLTTSLACLITLLRMCQWQVHVDGGFSNARLAWFQLHIADTVFLLVHTVALGYPLLLWLLW